MTNVSYAETIRASNFQISLPDMTPLRKARIDRGMTIYELAREAEVRAPSVSRIERGYPTSPKTAKRLANAVGISVVHVLFPERYPEDD